MGKLPRGYVERTQPFKEGQKRYIYDDRATDNVCLAHILHLLPHPENNDEQLIVYRWYGKHRRHWWYGITETWKQDLWAEYIAKVVELKKIKKKKKKS